MSLLKRSKFADCVRILRLKQSPKGLFMAAGFLFSDKIRDISSWLELIAGIIIFSLVSSGTFILNDIVDIERDIHHSKKKNRPLAAKRISIKMAVYLSSLLISGGIVGGLFLSKSFGLLLIFYFFWGLLYSHKMKEIVIIDALAVAAGYVMRVVGGNFLLELTSTFWILSCTFFLALLLSLGKRYSELSTLKHKAIYHRKVLSKYTTKLLSQLMILSTSLTIVIYSLFTVMTVKFNGLSKFFLVLTIPVVVFALMYYCYIVFVFKKGQEPEIMVFTEHPIRYAIFVWLVIIITTSCFK